ncbi:MAG: DMT family transporter [Kiritimatiellia bacterium]
MIELLVCTLIWGASFVAQKLGAEHFGPFALSCYRNLLAGVALGLGVCLRDRLRARRADGGAAPREGFGWNRATWTGGGLGGVCLFAAMLTQQLGIERTSAGVSAFLTANYVLLVPVFGLLAGRRAGRGVWAGVALSLCGTFLICFADARALVSGFGLGAGEAWTLLCAALFAVQILVVERFAHACDMLLFSAVQVTTAGLVALPFVFLPGELARSSWAGFVRGLPALAWLGLVSSGIAYTLQNLGQAKVPAALASVVLSLEGAFAAVFGWLLLGDVLTLRQLSGCGLVFLAVLAAQLLPSSSAARRRDANAALTNI